MFTKVEIKQFKRIEKAQEQIEPVKNFQEFGFYFTKQFQSC